ncbi:poly [ADP-ribose] polymerase tankyrase-1-like [Culex quinquefasciatus]|uniref:poly [ADP-ribose] polymerase tankyrase-1-like n=1 Tax=Culex quinquefasciatus TaxID=7176 RepID=UPI0018E39824|nr:poly [ADP-ribose] polymerase tankyrase-1-like [Culex quinquefasciatus]
MEEFGSFDNRLEEIKLDWKDKNIYEPETVMQVAASNGLNRVIDRLYELGAPIATPGHNPLMQAVGNNRQDTVVWLLTDHFDHFDCTLRDEFGHLVKLKDQVVCYQYHTKEFYETHQDLLVEFFPEFREAIQESMAKATSSVRYYGVEGSFATANINVTELDKLPEPYSSVRGSNGETLLHLAVERDDKELFVRMLEGGCEMDALDNDGNHPVHLVKSEEMLDLIVDRHSEGRKLIQRTNNYGTPLLHKACQLYIDLEAQIALLEKVINYGAIVNQQNSNGESAVFFAGNYLLLEVLRNHGAQLDEVNKAGETALERHLGCFNVISAGYILSHIHDQPSFKQHAHKYLGLLMRHNRDFFVCDYFKVLEEHPDSARILFDSVYEHSREEASRLISKACRGALVYVSEMFLSGDYDLDYNFKHDFDNTPLIGLFDYMEEPNLHIVKQLLEKGVDVQVKNFWGRDALLTLVRGFRFAKCYGHGVETVQLLLDHGATIHTTDLDGNKPLHLAFVDGDAELVEFLVQNGADLGAVNCQGKRPNEMVTDSDKTLFYICD